MADSTRPEVIKADWIESVASQTTSLDKEDLANLVQIAEWRDEEIWYMILNRVFYYVQIPKHVRGKAQTDTEEKEIENRIREVCRGTMKPW